MRLICVAAAVLCLVAGAAVTDAQTSARIDSAQRAAKAELILERAVPVSDQYQEMTIRFQGYGTPSLGVYLEFPTSEKVDPDEFKVTGHVDSRFQLVSKVEADGEKVQVRIGLFEAQTPFQGLANGQQIATVRMPASVMAERVAVVDHKTSASDFAAHDIPLQVYAE